MDIRKEQVLTEAAEVSPEELEQINRFAKGELRTVAIRLLSKQERLR